MKHDRLQRQLFGMKPEVRGTKSGALARRAGGPVIGCREGVTPAMLTREGKFGKRRVDQQNALA
jgi:hypothetical protein